MADEGKRPSRVLGWVFGAVAGVLAAATVLLYWLVRRPAPGPRPPSSGVDPVQPPGTRGPGQPPAPADQPQPSASDGCEVNCNDSCDDACDQAVDGTCGAVTESCDGMTAGCTDAGSSCDSTSCDTGSVDCSSTVASGRSIVDTVALQVPWLSVRARVTLPAWAGIGAIRVYQRFVSRRLGTRCRYTPSCSEYGAVALRRFGALDGAMVALARIRRCTTAVPLGTHDALVG